MIAISLDDAERSIVHRTNVAIGKDENIVQEVSQRHQAIDPLSVARTYFAERDYPPNFGKPINSQTRSRSEVCTG